MALFVIDLSTNLAEVVHSTESDDGMARAEEYSKEISDIDNELRLVEAALQHTDLDAIIEIDLDDMDNDDVISVVHAVTASATSDLSKCHTCIGDPLRACFGHAGRSSPFRFADA